MKKLLLIGLLTVYGIADNSSVSFTPVVGGTYNSDETNLDNDYTYGLRVDFGRGDNLNDFLIHRLQLALDYSDEHDYNGFGGTSILRVGANALWDLSPNSDISPFILAGVGYQAFDDGVIAENESGIYASIGAGFEFRIDEDINFVVEGKDIISGSKTNYFLGNVGVRVKID